MSLVIRYDWQKSEIREIYDTPFLELVYQAASVHRQFHDSRKIQVCKLISIKTGGVQKIVVTVPSLLATKQR